MSASNIIEKTQVYTVYSFQPSFWMMSHVRKVHGIYISDDEAHERREMLQKRHKGISVFIHKEPIGDRDGKTTSDEWMKHCRFG